MKLYDDNLLAVATKAVQFFHYQFLYTCSVFSLNQLHLLMVGFTSKFSYLYEEH